MKNNIFNRIEMYSLFGLVLSAISLVSGVWVQRPLGPSLSGIALWQSLRTALAVQEVTADTYMQRTVFTWLTVILVAVAVQMFITARMFDQRRLTWWLLSAGVWSITFLAVCVLIFTFDARVSGVLLILLGCGVALVGEMAMIMGEYATMQTDPMGAVPLAAKRWASRLDEAREKNIPLSVLVIDMDPPANYREMAQFQVELRGRDLLLPVRNGLFVLLWQIAPENTPLISEKLLQVLHTRAGRKTRLGSACFPSDGTEIKTLLEHAVRAMQARQRYAPKVDESAPLPDYPAQSQALSILTPWENVLAEARLTQTPVIILCFEAARPLSSAEIFLAQKELRGRDSVVPFTNGFYALLWDTSYAGGEVVLSKLRDKLTESGIESHQKLAAFPEDGDGLQALLAKLGEV